MRSLLTLIAILGLVLAGCGDGDDDHHDGGHGNGGEVHVPDRYTEAVAKCSELSDDIGDLIDSGDLADVHKVAEKIKTLAEALAGLATSDLPQDSVADVNKAATALAALFTKIDDAGDSGDKDATIAAHNEMKTLIAELEALGAGADDDDDADGNGADDDADDDGMGDGNTDAGMFANPDAGICLVSGKAINPSRTAEHDGKTYAFCCNDCVEEFEANPEKFINQ